MYIQVSLLSGWAVPLWYQVPVQFSSQVKKTGTIVTVPFRNTLVPALVLRSCLITPKSSFIIKEIHNVQPFPQDKHYDAFIQELGFLYQIEPLIFIKRLQQFLYSKEEEQEFLDIVQEYRHKQISVLTPEQQGVWNAFLPLLQKNTFSPIVLHGVTGSGKTELYKRAIVEILSQQKAVLFLLPEVTLANAFEHRLRSELSNEIVIFGFHSGKTKGEKKRLWNALLEGKPMLIIGVHLPVLLPISNLGLIIVDEEHDVGYQEKKHPKINSKHAALLRAQKVNIPLILGSATPSMQTLYRVKTEKWHFFQLKKRFSGSFPEIKVVPLLEQKHHRKNFWISKELQAAITDRLLKKEQTIVFLNRRGFSFFVQCKSCSFIFACCRCSVSLTLHNSQQLACHYCGIRINLPSYCASCKADDSHFIKKGIGTQQAVTILQSLFPNACIARADRDITQKKNTWKKIIEDFTKGTIDILVGTQTVTKGYHFPNVTLVGILWADVNVNFPIFNAAEITLQQLIQVAGRAGRAKHSSCVIVQTMANHDIFSYINEVDYLKFYAQEMISRKELLYPPYYCLVEIELKNNSETKVDKDAFCIAEELRLYIQSSNNSNLMILGPAKPLVHKVQNVYSRALYIKAPSHLEIMTLFKKLSLNQYTSKIYCTPVL